MKAARASEVVAVGSLQDARTRVSPGPWSAHVGTVAADWGVAATAAALPVVAAVRRG